ncbi:hypothetical protein NESM_000185500 [Novymonas esmeraldas]|uniref:Uncharacterized protein n=1 Tax=Novymonas esmeraldas TaxID=1808958 RepID=A0AAW0F7R5_9TRYP
MRGAKQRLDAHEDAAASRVASLLLQRPHTGDRRDADALRGMTAQVEAFLARAPGVPAVRMEPDCMELGGDSCEGRDGGGSCSGAEEHAGPTVELSVVAGVLEEVDQTAEADAMAHVGGVLLPTAANQVELQRRRVQQAQAMLDLLSALSPSVPTRAEGVAASAAAPGGDAEDSDDDNSVAVMDADDLMGEDSSDEETPAPHRRVVELN